MVPSWQTADQIREPAHLGASGGSIYITTGVLSGTGAIHAKGGVGHKTNVDMGAGGGGRIAVILTAADTFADVAINADGGSANAAQNGAAGTLYLQTSAQGSGRGTVIINNSDQTTMARTHIPPAINPVLGELSNASATVTNRGALAITASDRIASLTIDSATEPMNLGPAAAVLEVKSLSVNGTAYTKGGTYTSADWNGHSPTPSNVTGDGAIAIQPGGSLFLLR